MSSIPVVPVAAPKPVLNTRDAIGLIVGLIIGSGIFKLPQFVAMNSVSEWMFLGVWVLGGVLSLIGALCYAELAAAYPNAGGDYYFLQRAYGRTVSFLFAWARISVITTGAIALLAFVFGDYMSNLLRLGPQSSGIWAGIAVVVFTMINLIGIRETKSAQNWLTVLEVLGVVAVIVTGVLIAAPAAAPAPPIPPVAAAAANPWYSSIGTAMIFVLFTYSGWNEAAYISAELRERRSLVRALSLSILLVTLLYVLINFGFLRSLGMEGIAKSSTVAADLLGKTFGPGAATIISLIVAISALTSINATVIVGARSNYALGRDWSVFRWLGHWDERTGAPRNAVILQGVVALALVIAGSFARDGVEAMINYTTPVFYFFFLLVGVGLFILRAREPQVERPFKVPLYPLTPIVFILMCAGLLWSSIAYNGLYSLVGVGVVAVGLILLLVSKR